MKQSLTQGPVLRRILFFSMPIILGTLFQTFYNIIDTIIVGRMLGIDSLAAVGATGSVNFLILGFVSGTCAGMTIPIAQRFGAGDHEGLRRYTVNSVYLAVFISIILTPLMVIFTKPILRLMLTPENIIDMSSKYISIIFAGIPAAFIYNLTSGILRSVGDSRTPLYYLIFSSLLNIALDILSIQWLRMDVAGPAIATVLSQLIAGLLCIGTIIRRYPILRLRRAELPPSIYCISKLAANGVPMGLQYSITAIGSVILQSAVNSLGSDVVAGVTIAGRISMLLGNCEMDSLGTAMATYTGQNYGAGFYSRITEGARKAIGASAVYSVFAALAMYYAGPALIRLFMTESAAGSSVYACARQMSVTFGCSYFFLGILSVLRFSIQGLGYGFAALLSGVAEMIARSLLGLWLIPKFGFGAACFSNPLAWVFADITLFIIWIPVIKRTRIKLCPAG